MRKNLPFKQLLSGVFTSLILFIYNLSAAQSGPDPNFGTNGLVTTNFGFGATDDVPYTMALQQDGKIILAGGTNSFRLARYNSDGSLDASFGTGGLTQINLGVGSSIIYDIEILPDGTILAAGVLKGPSSKAYIFKFLPNGNLDLGIGSGTGYVLISAAFSAPFENLNIDFQSDGKVIIQLTEADNTTYLRRHNSDFTFDTGLKLLTNFFGTGLAVSPNDEIVISGYNANPGNFALTKLSSDGSSLGEIVETDFGGVDKANSMTLQPDGKILLAGHSGFNQWAIARYNPDGALDYEFSSDGKIQTLASSSLSWAKDIAVQPDGKILIAGYFDGKFTITRYLNNGDLDICFGVGGKASVDFPGTSDELFSMALQPDGNILLSGYAIPGSSSYDFALARYIPSTAPDQTWYLDGDRDGYGDDNNNIISCIDPSTPDQQMCTDPTDVTTCITIPGSKYFLVGGDCDDNNVTVYPGATEICDGLDNNCDGEVDEGVNAQTWYLDADNDGYGDDNTAQTACVQPAPQTVKIDPSCFEDPVLGLFCELKTIYWITTGGDCDDNSNTINPGAPEVCDGFDNNCNGQVDDGLPTTLYFTDADNDGYGSGSGTEFCSNPGTGWSSQSGDCNDSNDDIHPGANGGLELCDGIDNDCDGVIDEGCSGKPTISINNVTVYESEGVAVLILSLSHITTLQVKINYRTGDGTAVSTKKEKDYKAIGNTALTIPPGTLTTTITIPIYNDGKVENNEYFYVILSKPGNSVLGTVTGMVTIRDGAPIAQSAKSAKTSLEKSMVSTDEFEIKAYPNPSNNHFTLQMKTGNQKENVLMKVYDVMGRLVETKNNINPGATIVVGDRYKSGVYIIELTQGKQRRQLKLVKIN